MIPKDKAQELFEKHFEFAEALSTSNQIYNTKQCAIITVDEIKEVVSLCIPYKDEKSYIDYWQQVKHEIEQL